MLRGFEVVNAVADGEEALAAVIRACPDGVLLDVNLPGRDGYAVAASLAAVCPAARIVLTSSDVDGVSTAVLDDCGATAFVPKTELAIVDLGRLFSGGG
jgi:two-component system response regulator DesR